MHDIEPHYRWRNIYCAEDDPYSPFYGREYSEFEFTNSVYDHYIHPQWDDFGSHTLYLKILYADYEQACVIIELIGEWNDCLYNDIMLLKREVIEHLMHQGISKFILIGEHVLNFHSSDDCYYEEWFEEVNENEGWIALVNFKDYVLEEFKSANIDSYLVMEGKINDINWRTLNPLQLFEKVQQLVLKRLS
jgi:hypothetical protein